VSELTVDNVQTMSSVEISQLTGKRHDNVIADIEKMLKELEIGHLKFQGSYQSTQNKQLKCYNLDKKHTLCLIAKYDTKTRMSIINRWFEVEQAGYELVEAYRRADPRILRKMADISEDNQRLIGENSVLNSENRILEENLCSAEETIKTIKPMAEYGTKVFHSVNTYTSTNIAAEMGITAVKLNRILKAKAVIKRGTGAADYALCSKFQGHGFIKYATHTHENSLGESVVKKQMRWTRKGFDWLLEQKDKILSEGEKLKIKG